ncbi:MAG TPA: hypothetical protein VMT17_17200 [Anaeromyxobacteraceae bacterium]|nr:hypothetical protein [Anaeromyxobacteraceae bacterium]
MTGTEAVVAGSPEFLGALLEPLQARLGGAPRVADSPHLAFALCQDSARLLVYEYRGQEWLPLCDDLRRNGGPGISIVVALPPEHAAAAAELSSSASAVVAWSGEPRAVLDAVARIVAPQAAPAPGRPAPVLKPQQAAPAPVPPRSVVPPSPRPAVTPVRPAAAPVTPSPRPAVTPPRPTATPVAPAPRPAAKPAPAAPATPSANPEVAAPPAPRPVPYVAEPVAPAVDVDPFADLFDEPTEDAIPVAGEGDPEPVEAARPAAAPAVQFLSSSTWPGTVLSGTEAEGLLAGALVGLWPEDSLRPLTEKVLQGLSDAERAALQDRSLPIDSAVLKRAAGLRWQVAAALATVPAPNTPVDENALRAILAGTDGVLAELKGLSEGATPDALRIIENVRHAVVREAIDLTEAVQRVVPAEVAAEITASRPVGRAAATRLLYSTAGSKDLERPKPWGLVVTLGLAFAAAVGYHGYRYVNRPRPVAPAVTGAPTGSLATASPQGKLVFSPPGKQLDPREVEQFKNGELAKGNEVQEVLPGVFVVHPPGTKSAGGAQPAQEKKP